MSKRPPKENLIPRRGRGKPQPEKDALVKRVPPPRPNPHPPRTPTGNQRGR